MATRAGNKDWVLGVGLDISEVMEKYTKIKKKIGKLAIKSSEANTLQKSGIKKVNKALERQVGLLERRAMLLNKVDKGGTVGGLRTTTKDRKGQGLPFLATGAGVVAATSTAIEDKLKKAPKAERRASISKLRGFAGRKEQAGIKIDETLSGSRATRLSIQDSASPALVSMSEKLKVAEERLKDLKGRLRGIKDPGAFRALKTKIAATTKEIKRQTRSVTKATSAFKKHNRVTKSLTTSTNHLLRSYVSIFAIGAAVGMFFKLGEEMESLQASMLAASGSAVQAGRDFEFIRDASLHLGINLKEATNGYTKLGAAARAANFSQDQTKNIFLAASESARAFGLNAQRTNLVFLAFTQMLSKGKVSMEELRRQLGEQIPGAFQIAAKSMNMTTAELDKLVSSGKLASEDFLPAFADELRKVVRDTGALEKALVKVQAERQRFVSTAQLQTSIGFDAGAEGLASTFQNLSIAVEASESIFKVFGRTLGFTGRILSSLLNVVVPIVSIFTESLETLFDAFDRASDASVSLDKLTFIEVIFRELAIASLLVQKGFLSLELMLLNFADSFGATDEEGARLVAQLKSLVAMFLIFGLSIRAIIFSLRLLFIPFKALKKFLNFFGINFGNVFGSSIKKASLLSKILKGIGGTAAFVAFSGLDIVNPANKDKGKEIAGFAGTLAGAAIGASFLATVGALLGGPVGGAIGAFIGGIIGAVLGETGAEKLFTKVKSLDWGFIGKRIGEAMLLPFKFLLPASFFSGDVIEAGASLLGSSPATATAATVGSGRSGRNARSANTFVIKQEITFNGDASDQAVKDVTKATEDANRDLFNRIYDERFNSMQTPTL